MLVVGVVDESSGLEEESSQSMAMDSDPGHAYSSADIPGPLWVRLLRLNNMQLKTFADTPFDLLAQHLHLHVCLSDDVLSISVDGITCIFIFFIWSCMFYVNVF